MALQFDTNTRNKILDAIETAGGATVAMEIRSGTKPISCSTAPSASTVLVTINLPGDWMQDAASAQKQKSVAAWQDPTADAAGTASYFRLYSSTSTKNETTCFMQGDVGSDLVLDNPVIAAGQQVTINTFTLTGGNP